MPRGELAAPACTQLSDVRLKLETKAEMKRRLGRSPDDGSGEAAPVAAVTDATTESGPEEATAESAPPAATEVAVRERMSNLDVPALQARFKEFTGRDSTSTDKRCLVWRVQQALKGRVPTGPRWTRRREGEATPTKVLPVRVPAAVAGPLDEVRRRLGLRSCNEMIHKAMAAFLINAGESDLAGHFGATFTPDAAAAE
jgi:hypothetical protein